MNKLKPHLPLILLLITTSLIVWPTLLTGYFFHHDDLQVMRVFEMRKCLEDLQIPCRWVPDMGYGNGYPLFNYYGVLPYYIGGALSFIFGFVGAAKALFFIPLVLGGIGMYFLGREIFGRWGGLLSAVLYQFAPYRALDAYVRGAIAESFALAIIPFVFYFNLKVIKEPNIRNIIGMSISLGAFFMSHNIMTMFFMPVLIIWNIYWLAQQKFHNLKVMILSHGLGLGLSAFFLIPAFLEKGLVKSESLIQGGTDFRAHFVTVSQLFFNRTWEYGASVFGPNDTISFQIGWPMWWLVAIGGLFALFGFYKNYTSGKAVYKNLYLLFLLVVIFMISVILMHNKTGFIWEQISLLQYAQFPWRLLSVAIFVASIISGFVILYLPVKMQKIISILLIGVTIFLNWQFFKPKDFYPWVDDHVKLSDPLWEIQQKAGVADYLPQTTWLEPQSRAPDYPEIRKGQVISEKFKVYTNHFESKLTVSQEATVEFPVLDFPNWQVWVNGKKVDHYYDKHWGRISLDLQPGEYNISARLLDTPIRIISNLISLISFAVLFFLIFQKKNIAKLLKLKI